MEAIFAQMIAEQQQILNGLAALDELARKLQFAVQAKEQDLVVAHARVAELERQTEMLKASAAAHAKRNEILHGQLAHIALASLFGAVRS